MPNTPQRKPTAGATLRAEQSRLLTALERAHGRGWSARHMRRLAEKLLRLCVLAEAEAAGDLLGVYRSDELRELYRGRRGAACSIDHDSYIAGGEIVLHGDEEAP